MTQARELVQWGKDVVFPFWSERAWDGQNLNFYEALDLKGDPIMDMRRRVRVQARQVYVFARIHHEGWMQTLPIAERGMARLKEIAWEADGVPGWSHLIHPDGSIASPVRDLYDHAFLMLALAGMITATGEQQYRDLARQTLDFIDGRMRSDHGGYVESIGGPLSPRRQNPHMHLFECFLALFDATGDQIYLDRANEMRSLFDRFFFDPETGVLCEYFGDDLSPAKGEYARIAEPGHLAEWVWLLSEHTRLTGGELPREADLLYERVNSIGIAPRTDALAARISADGEMLDEGSRCWMQTEWIRAACVKLRHGFSDATRPVNFACSALLNHHLRPSIAGGWVDAIDARGNQVSKDIPASTLYHFVGAVAEMDRVSKDIDIVF